MAIEPDDRRKPASPSGVAASEPVAADSDDTADRPVDTDALIARAVEAARATPEDDASWRAISSNVLDRVRRLMGPSEPVIVHAADGAPTQDAEGSRTYLSTRVLVAALRRLLQQAPTHAPTGIDLTVDGDRLVDVELRLVGAYGTDLRALADQLHVEVLALLRDLLGPDPQLGAGTVSICFEDVVDGDPRTV